MVRVSENDVRGILDADCDISLTPFIKAAHQIVERVKACASKRGESLTEDELREIEKWLAGWFYSARDDERRLTSKRTLSASASFARSAGEEFKQMAIALDPSGCLNSILSNNRGRLVWLGKHSKKCPR